MIFFNYDPLGLLGLGFVVGFFIALISYILARLKGNEVPLIRKGILIMGALMIIILIPPAGAWNKIWLLLALSFTALIINYLLDTLYKLGIISHLVNPIQLKNASQFLYIFAILLAIGIIVSGSTKASMIAFKITKQIIIFLLGLWLALKVLWVKNTAN